MSARELQRLSAIALLTAREVLRQPAVLLILLASAYGAVLTPLVVANQLGEPGRLARDSALAFHFLFGMLLGASAAASTLTADLANGTAATVLCKAVSREAYLLAKFAGVLLVVVIFSCCATAATLLSERIAPRNFVIDWRLARWVLAGPLLSLAAAALRSYARRRPFPAFAVLLHGLTLGLVLLLACAFDALGPRGGAVAGFSWSLLPASGLITLALLMLSAAALALATRLRPAPVVAGLCLLFALGLMADSLPDLLRLRGTPLAWPALLVPNLERFWYAGQHPVAGGAALRLTLYAALYVAGTLGIGMLALRSREV